LWILHCEDGELGTDYCAEVTMDTRVFLTGSDLRIMIAFYVGINRNLKNIFGAEFNANLATLAALWDEIDLAARYLYFIQINRCTLKYFHRPLIL
jgi:hypothetical protein